MVLTLRHLLTPNRTNNFRARLLHPAGLSVLIGLYLFIQSGIKLIETTQLLPGGWVLGFSSSITPSQVVLETNKQRAAYGLSDLQSNEALTRAAQEKAAHMLSHDYWAHISPDGVTPWYFMHGQNYSYSVAGENLARDFSETSGMTQAWMESPTHRENILNPKYDEIGIAVVDGTLQGVETTLVVQMFGRRSAQAGTIPEVAQVDQAPAQLPAAVAVIEPELERSPVLSQVDVSEPQKRISPLWLNKGFATAFVTIMIVILALDLLLASRNNLQRRIGKSWAHLGLLSVLVMYVWVVAQGNIL